MGWTHDKPQFWQTRNEHFIARTNNAYSLRTWIILRNPSTLCTNIALCLRKTDKFQFVMSFVLTICAWFANPVHIYKCLVCKPCMNCTQTVWCELYTNSLVWTVHKQFGSQVCTRLNKRWNLVWAGLPTFQFCKPRQDKKITHSDHNFQSDFLKEGGIVPLPTEQWKTIFDEFST